MAKNPKEEEDEDFVNEMNALTSVFHDKFYIRLAQFIEKTGLSYNMFGKKIGSSGAQVSYMIVSKNNFGVKLLLRIFNEFPELNAEWLMRGEGGMLLSDNPKSKSEPIFRANTFISDIKASAGFGRLIDSPKLMEQLPAITLPNAPHGLNIAFQITGDSMHPTVRHLDYVAGNQISDINDIRNGYTYILIDKDDGVIYKRIYKEGKNIRIVSDNPDYTPYIREPQYILAYFKAFCRLSFDFRTYHDDIRREVMQLNQVVSNLQNDVDALKGKIK